MSCASLQWSDIRHVRVNCVQGRRVALFALHRTLLHRTLLLQVVLPYEYHFQNKLESALFVISALVIILGSTYTFLDEKVGCSSHFPSPRLHVALLAAATSSLPVCT